MTGHRMEWRGAEMNSTLARRVCECGWASAYVSALDAWTVPSRMDEIEAACQRHLDDVRRVLYLAVETLAIERREVRR